MNETIRQTKTEPSSISPLLRFVLAGMTQKGSEIGPHMATLYTLARNWSFGHIVEVGVGKGLATVALLSGVVEADKRLVSYDINEKSGLAASVAIGNSTALSHWEFRHKHSLVAPEDFPDASVSLLFVDTSRDYADTHDELAMWAPKLHPRGILCGSGPFLRDEGVKRAIEEFAAYSGDRFLEVIPGGIGLYILWPKEEAVADKTSPALEDAAHIPEELPAHGKLDPHISGGVLWLAGESWTGKISLAALLSERMMRRGTRVQVLDDEFRKGLFSDDLEPSAERITVGTARVASMLARQGVWAIVPATSEQRHTQARDVVDEYGMPFVSVLLQQGNANSESHNVVVDLDKDEHEAAFHVLEALTIRSENPPVILVGRGGSGTRLLSQIAQDCGVFIGVPGNVNECHDSLDWVDLIYRMVWDTRDDSGVPGDRYREDILKTAMHVLSVNPIPFGALWGWKLSETMLVLPLILEAFPGAKVIHILRHPTSSSLRRLHVTADPTNAVGEASLLGAYQYTGRDPSLSSLDEDWRRSAHTWLHQVTRVVRQGRTSLGPSRYLEIHYEDVCERPEEAVRSVAAFLGVAVPRYCPSFIIDRSRMNPWSPDDPRAEEIWDMCGRTASLLGYGPDGRVSQ